MTAISKALYLMLIISSTQFTSVLTESCSLKDAKKSLKFALQVLDLVNETCESSTEEKQIHIYYPCNINPSNCAELLASGFTTSGVYEVFPRWQKDMKPFQVYCDQETDGRGWTVFQRRGDYGENFYRNWTEYQIGFGNLMKEFWLGNDYISLLTTQDRMQLRIDLHDFEKDTRYAKYNDFLVLDEKKSYLMTFTDYIGDAGNAMNFHVGMTFVTYDKDDVNLCARNHKGGWWYAKCHAANLNGLYLKGKHESYADGVNWEPFKGHHYSLKTTEMKIRPQFFLKDSVTPL